MSNILIEKWKPILFCNGQYSVSNFGKIKRVYKLSRTGKLIVVNKLLNPSLNENGYERIIISFYDKGKIIKVHKKIHQLIAAAFIPNPNNKPCINHINAIKNDNHFLNLEWCTVEENNNHAISLGLIKIGRKEYIKRGYRTRCKKVVDTKTGKVYNSVFDLAEEIKVKPQFLHARLGNHKPNTTQYRYA